MNVHEDMEVSLELRRSLGLRDAPLLQPDPDEARLDAEIGRAIGLGHRDFVFKLSPVPDYRVTSEDSVVDAQNRARHELYMRRLSETGVDPVELARRQRMGFLAKARALATVKKVRSRARTQDQSGVQRLLHVV